MNRIPLLSRALAGALAPAFALAACGGAAGEPTHITDPPTTTMPVTGRAVPELASVDRAVMDLMVRWGIPGGAIAVVKDGRLVLARGYGYANVERKEPVQPDALFRIASVSKPFTAAAVMTLVEAGKLDLDARAFALLPDLPALPGATEDPRLATITVRQLLTHSGGWDRDVSFDPMFRTSEAAAAAGVPAPAGTNTIIRWMRGKPLDFDPGQRYAYSNFGYAVLGRIIEHVSGEPYESYVRAHVLVPAGITRMRIGHSLPAQRASGEVSYYDRSSGTSVFPSGGTVPFPDGGFYLEAMDSHGGWIASTVDLARFITAVDGRPTRPDFLSSTSIGEMTARPAGLWPGSAYYYGFGWLVRPAEGNWWHDGSLPGTASLIVRTGSGLAWAVLFNARDMLVGSQFESQIDATIWQGINGVTSWPAHDLFTEFP
jgi:N-acyl-D-amino-acid deacylase